MRAKKGPYFASSRASGFKHEEKTGADRSIELAISGDIESLETFIASHPDVINTKDEKYHNVPLHVACSKGDMPMIGLLIRKSASVNVQDMYGNAPIMYAIDKGREEVVQMLIRYGANVNLADFRGNTPLHNAAACNHYNICGMLLKQGADPDAYDFSNCKPLQRTTNPAIINMLEKASQAKKDGNEVGIQQTINWMGFGVGLGVGLGIALAKQTQHLQEQQRLLEEKKKAEMDEVLRKRREDAELLLAKAKASRNIQRKLL